MKNNVIKKSLSNLGYILITIILILYSLIVLYPVIWTVISSFKSTGEFYKNVWALPESWSTGFQNYKNAWKLAEIGSNLINSILVVSASMIINVVVCCMTAYVLARYKFRFAGFLTKLFIMGLFVPLVLGTIPTFFVLMHLKLYNTLIGLILVYATYSIPFSVFIMLGIYETLPTAFAEAAVLDGCSNSAIFWRIMFPLSQSGIITIAIFHFIWTWNDYIYAMTYITSNTKRTLSVGLVKLTSMATYRTDWGALFAGLMIVMIPSIIVYVLFQNQIQQGMTSGGVKG